MAVFGSVRLGPNAKVSEDAVSVGGELDTAEGSQVGGESVSIGFLPLLSLGLPAIPVVLGAFKQPGIRAEGRHITISLGELLQSQNLGDLIPLFTHLELRGAPGMLYLHFTFEIPPRKTP